MLNKIWLLLLMTVITAYGHELVTDVKKEKAVVVEIRYADGMPFSYEKYEVYYSGKPDIPFATGRTDRNGRLVFLPDKAGTWIVKAFSEDGHGVVEKIKVSTEGYHSGTDNEGPGRIFKLVLGLVMIAGFFGAVSLLWRRR